MLTPRYDVISAYPYLGRRQNQLSELKVMMAMAVHGKNRHYRWKEIRLEHWIETAKICGVSSGRRLIEDIVAQTPATIDSVASNIPKGFPEAVSEPIVKGLREHSAEIADALTRH